MGINPTHVGKIMAIPCHLVSRTATKIPYGGALVPYRVLHGHAPAKSGMASKFNERDDNERS